MNTCLY